MNNFDVNKPIVPALATGLQQIVDKKPYSECQSSNTGKLAFFNSRGNNKECIMYSQGYLQELCELETK